MSRKIGKRKSGQLETRLEGYAQAAGSLLHVVKQGGARALVPMTTAAGAALAMAPAADATIVWVANQNVDLPYTTATYGNVFDTAAINLDNAGTGGSEFDVRFAFTSVSNYVNISALTTMQGIFTTAGPSNAAANFASGAMISSGGNIANGSTFRTMFDFYGTTGFAGVQFNISGQTHYAWLRVQINGAGDFLTVLDWAYEDQPDTPIAAGAVPEPGSGAMVGLGLLALGARGVRHRRKRLAELAKAEAAPDSREG